MTSMRKSMARRRMSVRHSCYTGLIGGGIVLVGLILIQTVGLPFWGYLFLVFVGVALSYPLFKRWEGSYWDGTGSEFDRTNAPQ